MNINSLFTLFLYDVPSHILLLFLKRGAVCVCVRETHCIYIIYINIYIKFAGSTHTFFFSFGVPRLVHLVTQHEREGRRTPFFLGFVHYLQRERGIFCFAFDQLRIYIQCARTHHLKRKHLKLKKKY